MLGVDIADAKNATKKVRYVKGLVLNPDRTIILNGAIQPFMIQDAINAMIAMEDLDERKPIFIIIDSPGGYVESGWKFINTLKAIKPYTVGIVSGGAYSMAAIISLYVDKLYIMDSADMMYHEAAYCICGSESIVASRLANTQKYLHKMHTRVAQKLSLPLNEYFDKIKSEWWLLAEDAVRANIADAVLMSLKYELYTNKQIIMPFGDDVFNSVKPIIYMGIEQPKDIIRFKLN